VVARPPYLVLPPPSDLDRVARDLTRRGWQVHRGFTPADEPWDLAPTRLVAVGVVGDREAAEAALLCAVRGAGLVVTLDQDRSWAPGFLHDLARLEPARAAPAAPAADGDDAGSGTAGGGVATLTAEQCDLLDLLAAGHSIAEAARLRYLSLRTANRRVADARATLGVPTTREAVLAYVRLRGR
jgi:DNA-binding NarL/FixJ family response regulator